MAITAIAFLFLLKRKNLSVQSSIKDKLLKNTNNKLPEIEKLLELEKLAIREGNGIEHNSLLGDWKFISVWKKNNDYKDFVFGYLLRIFSATLNFKEGI